METAPRGDRRGDTDVDIETLKKVGRALSTAPDNFHLHKTLARQLQAKAHMFETGEGIDWATGEALAFGTLLDEEFPVRLSGQDSSRGTFSQRHSVFVDQENEERYVPLNHIREGQAEFEVVDSLLSEAAVLGFEYGYSLAEPRALVLWEAQFGDFANGAQVIIDQFIASGEMKWLRMSGLVLLLPHGFEGQGPEHSSARLERFLQLCADDNMQVVNLHDAGELLPRAETADAAQLPQAAGGDDAEIAAAPQARGIEALRVRARLVVPSRAVGRCAKQSRLDVDARAGRPDQARRPVLGQGLLRPLRGAREARREPHPDPASRTDLSVPGPGARPTS